MSANTWIWVHASGGNFASNWGTVVDGTLEYGLPGPGDVGGGVSGSVTGNGTIGLLEVSSAATFTGDITADEIAALGNITAQGMLTATDEFLINTGVTLTDNGSGVLNGPTAASTNGPFGNAGFEDFGTVVLGGFAQLNAYTVDDFGALQMSGGIVTATDLTVGSMTAEATMTLATAAVATDTLGQATGFRSSGGSGLVTINGGTWENQELLVGGFGAGTLIMQSGATVSATGPYQVFAGAPALAVGYSSAGGSIDIEGSVLSVTGDADIGYAGAGNLSISAGGSLSVTGTLDAGAISGGSGTLSVSDSGAVMTLGDYIVGDAGSHSDSITGASVDVTGSLSIGARNGGAGTLTLSGGASLSVGGNATVGDAGGGTLDVQAGTTVSVASGTLTVGNASGGTGTITLGGNGAEVTADALTIGNMGTGAITVGDSSTLATSGSLTLGLVHGGGNGMITVAGTGDLSVSGNMIVGSGGIGALDVNASSLDISGSLDIADGVASSGDVTLAQSTLSVGTITIGNSGAGTFSANQAAEVTATEIVVGAAKLGNGTFNLDGSGSEVQAGSMQVGNAGTGALQVTNHALLQVTGLATMGVTASANLQETAAIESNANWTSGSELDIGEKATGIVTVDTGGQVSAPSVILGDRATASGTVTVTGTGTLPSALGFGTLQVGNLGTGSLSLALGAQAGTADTAGTVEIGATAGAIGTVTLTDAGTKLQAQVLAVGGGAIAEGGSGALSIGAGASVDAGTVTVWGGGTITLAGGDLTTDPMTVDGEVSGYGTIAGAIANNGMITIQGGALTLSGSLSGSGVLDFAGVATLVLGKPGTGIAAPVLELAADDKIELAGLTITGAQVTSPGTVTVTTTGSSYLLSDVTFAAGAPQTFKTGHDSTTGDDFIKVACFAEGTRILTASGEVAVEALVPGDLVVTRSGRRRPVRWIGHRAIDLRCHPRPQDAHPVRVQADAFAPGTPHRDLRLSPDHAVHWRDVLIPVRYLINGATIRQEAVATIVYYHIELDTHDILLAEGLPAESYLDTGNRGAFENGGAVVQAHADFALGIWATQACAKLVVDGPALVAVCERLLARAHALGWSSTDTPAPLLFAGGQRIVPHECGDDVVTFLLPPDCRHARLLSRATIPVHLHPGSTDHRRLGLAVTELALDGTALPLDSARLGAGWHAPEPGLRWTDGAAELALAGEHALAVRFTRLLRYLSGREDEPARKQAGCAPEP